MKDHEAAWEVDNATRDAWVSVLPSLPTRARHEGRKCLE